MPAIGLNISGIDAKKFQEAAIGVKVNTNTNLKDVKEHSLAPLDKKCVSVDFEFSTNYVSQKDKKVADIIITGDVLFLDEGYKKIIDMWKKEKKLPDDVSLQVINVVFNKCLKKAILLSDDLQLPSPIPIPVAKKKE
jgi:predicted nicotinamide N-methyase